MMNLDPAIASIVITSELWSRPARLYDTEVAGMRRLAETMATEPAGIFQACVDLALELCGGDTAGISLYERTADGEEIFRWIAKAGRLKDLLEGTAPRHFSASGICVDSGAPLLLKNPERVYKYLDVGTPLHEALLIPLAAKDGNLQATLWIVSHDPQHRFCGDDARLMQRIAVFTATGFHLAGLVADARNTAAEAMLALRELDHRVKNTLLMTASVLGMQFARTADPAARTALETAQNRVLAVGRGHDIEGRQPGDLGAILRTVCADLIGEDYPIAVQVGVDEGIALPPHTEAVIALIANELITNAIKHAFADNRAGTLIVEGRRTDSGTVVLSVTDDGAPLPEAAAEKPGLGLNLVRALARQLNGEFRIDAVAKRFTVTFPAEDGPGATAPARSIVSPHLSATIRGIGHTLLDTPAASRPDSIADLPSDAVPPAR